MAIRKKNLPLVQYEKHEQNTYSVLKLHIKAKIELHLDIDIPGVDVPIYYHTYKEVCMTYSVRLM